MFSKSVVKTDAFLDMPLSTQALYFHLGMEADDEGFISNPKQVMRSVGASPDDYRVLMAKGLVFTFDSGICIIRDWKVNNYLRSDRFKPTQYLEEKSHVVTLPNRVYSLDFSACLPSGIPTDYQVVDERYTQYRIDKNRIDKGSAEGTDKPSAVTTPPGVGDEEKPKKGKKKRPQYAHDSKPYKCAAYLSDEIQKRKPSGNPVNEAALQNWASCFDKCNRIDRHPWEEIGAVLGWCQEDRFWQNQILSGGNFRDKYDRLLLQAKQKGVFDE